VTKTIIGIVILKTVCIHIVARDVQITANYNGSKAPESDFNLTENKRIGCVQFATQTKNIRKEPSFTLNLSLNYNSLELSTNEEVIVVQPLHSFPAFYGT
jgi:hypothetical protein